MSFSRKQAFGRRLIGGCVLFMLVGSGCNHATSKTEKALRAEWSQAMREHSYGGAKEIAQRLLALNRQDSGSWDRLVQAQLGLSDRDGIKQTLEEWRRAVSKASSKPDEYAGDLAFAEHDPAKAVQAWVKVLAREPQNTRILEKVARAEKVQQHWTDEDAAWTTYLQVHDDAMARLQRALCRRRLHRWQDAFADLKRAESLAPGNPEVQSAGKLFDKLGQFLPEIRELDAALAVSPNDSGLLADRALLFLRGGDYELGLEDSEGAARLGPWAIRPKLFKAIALIGLGRSDECETLAVQKFIRLATLTPEFLETISRLDSEISVERSNAELYVARAWQLNEINQPALALQDAENGVRLDPKSAGALAECSYALTKLDRVEEALREIKRATELDASFATAWQYRGELEMECGETLSAIESLSHALETNQTAAALQKRETCYRRLGLLVKADQDHKTLEELNSKVAK